MTLSLLPLWHSLYWLCRGLQLLAVQSVARGEAYSTKSPAEDLGRELLNSMGRQPSPSNAFHLCVQLGLMKHHENLFVREAGVRQVIQALVAAWLSLIVKTGLARSG